MSKWPFIAAGVALLLIVAGAIGFTLVTNGYKNQIRQLQNDVAARDVTIEVSKDVYSRLAVQTVGLQNALDLTAEENDRLMTELKAKKAELLTVQTIAVKWKKAYEAEATAHETPVTTPEGVVRRKIEFSKDFGYIIAEGYTLTDPPFAFVRVRQGHPLRLSVIMTQEPDKSWRGYATSSEENIGVDIEVSAVNPTLLDPKWYEKIGLHADVGVGSGVLVGVGASYKIGKFTVGPSVWGSMGWDVQPKGYLGVTMGWNPFQKD